MEIQSAYNNIPKEKVAQGTVVTIGNFDGVHLGHQAIIKNSISISATRGFRSLICTFEPHPAELFAGDKAPARLTRPERKQQLLENMGPDILLMQRFTREFAAMNPVRFVEEVLVGAMNARIIVVGKNFRFGKDRAGDIAYLSEAGQSHHFEVLAEDLLNTSLNMSTEVISSSRIRKLVDEGDVAMAASLLGRYHELPGTVVHGKKVGGQLGFPTLNIDAKKVLVPADGIYAGYVDVGSDRKIPAAIYVGNRPTLAHGYAIEAHLIDFNRVAYDEPAVVHFVDRVRENKKFKDIEGLQRQIAADIELIRRKLENRS